MIARLAADLTRVTTRLSAGACFGSTIATLAIMGGCRAGREII
jgi:hypothetical protein